MSSNDTRWRVSADPSGARWAIGTDSMRDPLDSVNAVLIRWQDDNRRLSAAAAQTPMTPLIVAMTRPLLDALQTRERYLRRVEREAWIAESNAKSALDAWRRKHIGP